MYAIMCCFLSKVVLGTSLWSPRLFSWWLQILLELAFLHSQVTVPADVGGISNLLSSKLVQLYMGEV